MMQQTNNQGPPFTKTSGHTDHWEIARGMRNLHWDKILHQDLKSCNILIDNWGIINDALLHAETDNKFFFCEVADFECSIGVVGTGFWRAPEILLAIQNGNITSNTFTKMADVYSYAMTCYEVLTGCILFEGHPRSDYSRVLSGKKPKVLDYIDPLTGALLAQCWHPNNLQMFISMCKYCLRTPATRCKR
ncbi:unnamed protein product [Sphagnum balticum]